MKNLKKITLCGYYGRGNLGDEIILDAILTKIKEVHPNANIQILKNKNLLSNARKMSGADLFVFGGGSILQNATSNASLFYYLTLIRLSTLLCKRKIMLANGIGPIISRQTTKKILLRALKHTINRFDYISVRDTNSQKFLQKLLPNRKIHLVPDPAIETFANINRGLINSPQSTPNNAFFVFCPQANALKKAQITPDTLAKSLLIVSNLHNARLKIVIFNEKEDLPIAKELKKHLKNVEIVIPHTANKAALAFLGAKFVISSRYHASLLAISLGLPTLSISTDPKILAISSDFFSSPANSPQILKYSTNFTYQITKMMKYHNKNKNLIMKKISSCTLTSKTSIKEALK